MKKILFAFALVLALSTCAFGDTIVFWEDFSTGVEGWQYAEWDGANERAITKNDYGVLYNDTMGFMFSPKENWVISYDLIVANTLDAFDPDRVLPSFYRPGYELYFTNADISVTAGSDYTTYSYTVDAGENHSGLAAGYWSGTTDIDELLNESYKYFYLNFNFDDYFESIMLPGATDNVYVDNVKIEAVPEPMTFVSLAAGLASLVGMRRFKK